MTQRTKEQIQSEIDSLTYTLKRIDQGDRYAKLWDQRVDLKWELSELKK